MNHENFASLDGLIAGYVAGNLPRPLHAMVSAHLELSEANRPLVAALETVAGETLAAIEPAPLSQRDAALAKIFSSGDGDASQISFAKKPTGSMPRVLENCIGMALEDIPWRTKMPGFREYELDDVDGFHVSLFWIKPGRAIPAHTHEGVEIALILDGAFTDSRGRYGRGDISVADHSVDHRPIAENDRPCIGFSVTDGPLRLTGPLHRRLADIISG